MPGAFDHYFEPTDLRFRASDPGLGPRVSDQG